jgi:hypothetical protein
MNSDAFADLAYGNDADVHQVVVPVLQPLRHARVRLWAGQLRRNIPIKEETPGSSEIDRTAGGFVTAEIEVHPPQR